MVKWFQKCPECGTVEAKGRYCTKCFTLITQECWMRYESAEPREAVLQRIEKARLARIEKRDKALLSRARA